MNGDDPRRLKLPKPCALLLREADGWELARNLVLKGMDLGAALHAFERIHLSHNGGCFVLKKVALRLVVFRGILAGLVLEIQVP